MGHQKPGMAPFSSKHHPIHQFVKEKLFLLMKRARNAQNSPYSDTYPYNIWKTIVPPGLLP
jgi:hypothetical protein